MMWNSDGGWGHGAFWGGWLMFFLMVLFIVAVIVAIVYLVRAAGDGTVQPPSAGTSEPPRDILKRRYAAGEIEREEYLQKLSDL